MIAYRHTDPRFAFLREHIPHPAGRWNVQNEVTHYLCDTPDGAWAEFLRHEEISDAEDLLTIRRDLWAVEIGDEPGALPELPPQTLAGGPATWPDCQREAGRLRNQGEAGITAPSAALNPGAAHGWRVEGGLRQGPPRDGKDNAQIRAQAVVLDWLGRTICGFRPSKLQSSATGASRVLGESSPRQESNKPRSRVLDLLES